MRLFSKGSKQKIKVDIHSHLIPSIDDGAQSIVQSLEMIQVFADQGYEKLITTPHIHPNYPNTIDQINQGLSSLKTAILENEISIEIEAGAEYFVDENFLMVLKKDEPILFFGDHYVLVESSFLNKPIFFEEALFELMSKGYKPVLAHPERYRFLEGSLDWLIELKQMGVLLQVTLGSLSGYYGKIPQQVSKILLKTKMIDFLGSDLHRVAQFEFLKKGVEQKEIKSLIRSGTLKNDDLL